MASSLRTSIETSKSCSVLSYPYYESLASPITYSSMSSLITLIESAKITSSPSSQNNSLLIIAVKESIAGNDIQVETNIELTAASIDCNGNQTLIVAAIYRPPGRDLKYNER
ncbi:hypothetical protein DPMN_138813 [Dreissena polymorpha]|uniref:Uncharacterized protein n=1 Tax=Dreissena polymorpha TaxID=45954 RepID=A0A9D4G4X8_DREPO|nr:hypothetical protein DPMN_138813 [Dreissena polymorpha]